MTETKRPSDADLDRAIQIATAGRPGLEQTIISNSRHWTAEDVERIINPPQWHKCMG